MMATASPRRRRSQNCPSFPTIWPTQPSLSSTPPRRKIRPRCRTGAPPRLLPHPLRTALLRGCSLRSRPCWGLFPGTTPLWRWSRMGMCLLPLPYSEHQKAQNQVPFASHQWVRVDLCSLLSRPSHQCLWSLKMGHIRDQRQRSSHFSSPEHFHLICKVTPRQQTASAPAQTVSSVLVRYFLVWGRCGIYRFIFSNYRFTEKLQDQYKELSLLRLTDYLLKPLPFCPEQWACFLRARKSV